MKPGLTDFFKNSFRASVFIFTLNLVLKILFIATQDVAMDEPFSIFYAQWDLLPMIKFLATGINPPLYEVFLHFWIKLFGISPFAVRLPSVIFSSFTAVIIFRMGYGFFSSRAAWLSALVFTFSTQQIYFSHEARVYALVAMLTACSLYYFLQIVKQPEKKVNFYFLLLSNLFLIYAHYTAVFVLFSQVVAVFIVPELRKNIRKFILLFSGLLLLYLPNLIVAISKANFYLHVSRWLPHPQWSQLYGELNHFLNLRYVTAVFIVLFIAALVISRKNWKQLIESQKSNPFFKIILIWFFVSYLSIFLVSLFSAMFSSRYINFNCIGFYLFIGVILSLLWEGKKWPVAFALVVAMALTCNPDPTNDRKLKQVVEKVVKNRSDSTVVLIAPHYADLSFLYHYNQAIFKDHENVHKNLETEKIYPVSSVDDVKNVLQNKPSSCIYIQAGTGATDPADSLLTYIQSSFTVSKHDSCWAIYRINYFSQPK